MIPGKGIPVERSSPRRGNINMRGVGVMPAAQATNFKLLHDYAQIILLKVDIYSIIVENLDGAARPSIERRRCEFTGALL
jgi:hypothetical protein